MLQGVAAGFTMDAIDGRVPARQSSVSSTGEPTSVRRRADVDGNNMGSRLRRPDYSQHPPKPGATEADDMYCDESLLNMIFTSQQDPDTYVNVIGCGSRKIILPEDSDTSKDTDGEKRRSSSVGSNASGVTGDGQEETDVVISGTSESFNSSERSDTSAKDTVGPNGNNVSHSCPSNSDSGADIHSESSPFGGSSYSLMELCVAYEKASEAMDQEKKREENVFNIIDTYLTKVSLLRCSFCDVTSMASEAMDQEKKREENVFNVIDTYLTKVCLLRCSFCDVTSIPSDELVTSTVNCNLQRSSECSEEDAIAALEKRLAAVKDYVSGFCNEATMQENRSHEVSQVYWKQSTYDGADLRAASGSGSRMPVTVGNVRYNYTERKVSNSARKSRNAVVRQRKIMSKLCAIAQRLVSRAEISYHLISNCLKTITIGLTPALRTCTQMEEVVRKLDSGGRGLPAFRDAASAVTQWTSEALLTAERAVDLHRDAREALQASLWDLDLMRSYQLQGIKVSRDIMAAGDCFLGLVRQPNVSVAKIKNQESNMKQMRASLLPVLIQMRSLRILIEQWSEMCSDTVSAVLQALYIATQSSCNAIEGSVKAVQGILVPAGIDLEERPI
ncbi:uncharacterized protein LOC126327511 isoform X1 [Schistocerca gregaria]|uniref:uncharacterized protein LOC126327511 isoform X1 n=1 Tax=Schistocerca gregaria TaxID=7010 RepID=UPI00211E35B3|nr:uncharacterized protein LOC126327511 isoform X1 [Schistocerca gregaria]